LIAFGYVYWFRRILFSFCALCAGVLFTALQTVGTNDDGDAAQKTQATRRRSNTSDVN